MILLSELSRRRIRSVQKLIRVGRNEVVVVLRVDKEKGYIDLSKRRVSPEDIVKCEERYMKSKTVASILRHVASKVPPSLDTTMNGESVIVGGGGVSDDLGPQQTQESKKAMRKARHQAQEDEDGLVGVDAGGVVVDAGVGVLGNVNEEETLEKLYETIAWPIGKKYRHPYDAFKLSLTYVLAFQYFLTDMELYDSEPDSVWSSLPEPIAPSTLSLLTITIARRLTPQPIKLRADVELTCYTPQGIDAIRQALRAGEKQSSEAVPIKVKLVAPPLYILSTNATDKVCHFVERR